MYALLPLRLVATAKLLFGLCRLDVFVSHLDMAYDEALRAFPYVVQVSWGGGGESRGRDGLQRIEWR